MPIGRCVSYLGFSYSEAGWHPFRAVVEEISKSVSLRYEESCLCSFYQRFQPDTLAAAYHLDRQKAPVLSRIPAHCLIHYYPWQERAKRASRQESQHFGPSPHLGPENFNGLAELYRSISRHGYRPAEFPADPITGVRLRMGGEERFIVRRGQHRVAVLAALGWSEIPTEPAATVDVGGAESWPMVVVGDLAISEAKAVAEQYFVLNGRERAPE